MAAITVSEDIVNLALLKLGKAPVQSLTENVTEARVADQYYDLTRQSLIRQYMPPFTVTRASISRSGTPLFEYSDEYQLPLDCLRVKGIYSTTAPYDYEQEGYTIEARKLLANASGAAELKLVYAADTNLVPQFDSCFVELFAAALAYKIAYALSLKTSAKEQMEREVAAAERTAATAWQQETPLVVNRESQLTKARRNSLLGDWGIK
jgi:hypothetical protein